MNEDLSKVINSFHRARHSGGLFTTFYEIFLQKSPEIEPLFARTDFERQKRMLKQSLLELLNYAGGIESAVEEIARLAGKHAGMSIKKSHYSMWLDALCEAVAIHDSEFTPELEELWRQSLQPGIDAMTNYLPQPDRNE